MKRIFPAVSSFLSTVSLLLALLLLMGSFGQVLRDRWVFTGLLMAIPLLPLGAVALAIDLLRRGRALRRIPLGLTILGGAGAGWAIYVGMGDPFSAARPSAAEPLRLLHWNVQWGGGRGGNESAFARQCDAIVAREADIVVLSEAPHCDRVAALSAKLHFEPAVCVENEPGRSYWYRLAVTSRWPVRKEGSYELAGGVAMSAVVEMPDRELRLLVVDGLSNPFAARLPLLRDVDKLQRSARMLGRPFDVITGDFNTTSRSIGFDALRASRFQLASEDAGGWRGTFPSFLPVYDIDHVWTAPHFSVTGCDFFAQHSTTNHRGQLVRLTPARIIALPAGDR